MGKLLVFSHTFSSLHQCLKYMVLTYFLHYHFDRHFHHHTHAWNTWSLHIIFIIISTSSDQTKHISWSQKHIECNLQCQANTWQKKAKISIFDINFTITPMLKIHGHYFFYSSWRHLHLTKSRTSKQVRIIWM